MLLTADRLFPKKSHIYKFLINLLKTYRQTQSIFGIKIIIYIPLKQIEGK